MNIDLDSRGEGHNESERGRSWEYLGLAFTNETL